MLWLLLNFFVTVMEQQTNDAHLLSSMRLKKDFKIKTHRSLLPVTMATLTLAESRRLYSWWWDSHISPKNSKWLQENLADIDANVKIMIKLIEHDAESFAQKAEMFYKNRPELMKLVEEFYRAYRALAERYDQATEALRQVHRKMAEAFPNGIPLEFSDEPSAGSSSTDAESHSLEVPSILFAPDHLQHKLLRTSLDNELTKTHYDESYTSSRENIMKQPDRMSTRKGSSVQVEERKCLECKLLQKEITCLSKENQDLKNQITLELTKAEKAESEANHLKEISSRIKMEKADALSQCKESKTRVATLENEISCMQTDLKKLDDEMLKRDKFLNLAKARNLSLEKTNQTLISGLDRLNERIREQETELKMKNDELDQLSVSLKDEQQGRKKDELACYSIKMQLAECQEEMKNLTMEIQNGGKKMKDVQLSKTSLEEALQNIREENDKLTEEKFWSALKIINLQDEIISLRGLNEKLQGELNHRVEEKASIQHELCCLKEDRNDLEKRYHALMDEVHAVNLNVQFLQSMVQGLRDGNFELKETVKKYETEKQLHLRTLKHIETVSDKNDSLEVSISNANNEIERLRKRITTLEDSCYHLHGRISINQAEKALLVSHVEAFSKNMEKLSRENTFLENSLFDMNAELDGFKGRLKDMELSCQSLHDENSRLLSEKTTLISQAESIRLSLKNLESRYASLEGRHTHLEKEKESTLQQVEKLQEMLRLEREEHSALIKSSNGQLRALIKQIHLLQVEGRQRQEELEQEKLNIMNAQIEIFILQRCLRDMKEGTTSFSIGTQKHQDTLGSTEKLVSHLEQECHIQEEKITSLTAHNKKLKEWMHLIMNLLKIDMEHVSLDHVRDEVLLQLILHEIRKLLRTISETQDEKQHVLLEKSVVLALLEQFGAYVTELRSEKAALEKESITRINCLAAVKNENDKLLKVNEQLREEVQTSNKRQDALKAEVDILSGELSDLQQVYFSLQIVVSNISQENHSISEKLSRLCEKKEKLEEENSVILADVVALDCLALVLKTSITEKGTELQLLSSVRNYLDVVQVDLDEQIRAINENIIMLHAGSTLIKESLPKLENDKGLIEFQGNISNRYLNDKRSIGMLLMETMDLPETNFTLHSEQCSNDGLCRNHGDLKLDFNMFKVSKHEMESNSCNEIDNGYLHQENEVLNGGIRGLQTEDEELRVREKYLSSGLQNETDKKFSDTVIDIQLVTNNAKLFKVKVHELIKACKLLETSNRMQIEIFKEEIKEKNFTINELDEKLNALEVENRGLIAELKGFLVLLRSMRDDISQVEEGTTSQARRHITGKAPHDKSSPEPTSSRGGTATPGLLKLKDFHSKFEVIGKVMTEAGDLLELERLNSAASLNSTWKDIAGLASIVISQSEMSNLKCGQSTRDVQPDIVVNSSRCSNEDLSDIWDTTNADEIIDHISESELCRTSGVSCSDRKLKASLVIPDDDTACHHTGMEDDRCPLLELVDEKGSGVDKLLFPIKYETQKQWNRRVMESLSSDGHRLLVLNACVKELQKTIEPSEKSNHLTKSELNPVKAQLKEAEGTISKLIDTNSKLTKKVEDLSVFPDDEVIQRKGEGSKNQRQITDQARKVSEKIGRLELEMQKIQYNLLKTDEEYPTNRTKTVGKSAGVILKQYIYGRRDSRRQKKGSSCGCMRPNADSDD